MNSIPKTITSQPDRAQFDAWYGPELIECIHAKETAWLNYKAGWLACSSQKTEEIHD